MCVAKVGMTYITLTCKRGREARKRWPSLTFQSKAM